MDQERLEELLDRARGSGRDRLVEVARRRGPRPSSTWWWSSGRVRAVLTRGEVALTSDGAGIRLDHDELRSLARLCGLWERARHRWASFEVSSAGLPGSVARDLLYQPPGRNAEPVVVGRWRMGCHMGKDFVGEDELVPLGRPTGAVIAEIWRRGERQGPRAGSLVGLRYHLGEGLVVDARREELRIVRARRGALLVLDCGTEDERCPWQSRDEVVLEAGAAPFVRAVVRAVARTSGSLRLR